GEPVHLTISLLDPFDTGADDILRPDPVEFRHPDGSAAPLRPTFRHTQANSFEAWVTFERQGEWQVVLYPDVPSGERHALPTVGPTERTLSVTSPPAGWVGPALLVAMAFGLFAIALGGRNRKGPPKKKLAPVTGGDTWWSGGWWPRPSFLPR
ncbi:MAG: hypothetical protein ACR2NL_00495, partial [Acidimicrobiia bacterium]